MLFMLMASDVAGSTEARQAAREAHLARLKTLQAAGRLVLAGPCPLPEGEAGFSGSLIVAEFESLDEAEEWAGQDPYVEAGVYSEILIRPFKKVLPE
ncbi:YciI family protein [Eikenella sp. S3360]|uniref:YciI family protein n=1 Tax=Eikenella glucosivorans TaxID=2766967 RepID=A0ABS0NBG8_9NEIS|nr:YciI family protein [Eikenella glucosivorans]MBH5329661.1 YciI family protein [Eikenella glucosivorans]